MKALEAIKILQNNKNSIIHKVNPSSNKCATNFEIPFHFQIHAQSHALCDIFLSASQNEKQERHLKSFNYKRILIEMLLWMALLLSYNVGNRATIYPLSLSLLFDICTT